MNRTAFIGILESNLDGVAPGSLAESTVLADLPQWDSLAVLTTISVIGESYGRTVSGSQIGRCRTVGELATLAEGV